MKGPLPASNFDFTICSCGCMWDLGNTPGGSSWKFAFLEWTHPGECLVSSRFSGFFVSNHGFGSGAPGRLKVVLGTTDTVKYFCGRLECYWLLQRCSRNGSS